MTPEESLGLEEKLRVSDPMRADKQTASARQVASVKPSVAAGWDESVDLSRGPAVIPQLAETPVPAALKARIEGHMAKYPDRRSAVIPALFAAQEHHGWLSPEAMDQVAAVMRMTPASLSEIATFYDMFRTTPVGSSYLYVCTSVACHLSQAKRVYEAIRQAAEDQGLEDTEVREFACLGACDMAPMASVDGRYIGPLDPGDAAEIVASVREGRSPLPGRGLEDEDFRLPHQQRESAPAGTPEVAAAPTDRGGGPSLYPARTPEAEATRARRERDR